MGSISAVDAFWDESDEYDANNEKYRSGVFLNGPIYQISPEQLQQITFGPLAARVIECVHPDRLADYIIDNSIRVRAPSSFFRQECLAHWNNVQATLKNINWMNGSVLAFCGAGGLWSMHNPFWLTIFGVIGVAAAILIGIGLHKISKASDQIEAWSLDPVAAIANRRAEAYQKGFAHVYHNNLKISSQPSKQGVLHPTEVQYLYQIYLPNFCTTLLNKNLDHKNQWMLDFLTINPLSMSVVNYVYGQTPDFLQAAVNDYVKLENILKDIQKHFENLKSDIRDQATQAIDVYKNQKIAALVPLEVARDHYISIAHDKLDQKLKNEIDPEKKQTLRKEFDAQVEKYNLFYSVAAAPIHLYFDSQIQQTRTTRDNAIREINYHESQNLAVYYPAAKELLQKIFSFWTQQAAYQSLNLDHYNTFFCPIPSAPPRAPTFQIYHQPPPLDWSSAQRSEYEAYLNYLKMQEEISQTRVGG